MQVNLNRTQDKKMSRFFPASVPPASRIVQYAVPRESPTGDGGKRHGSRETPEGSRAGEVMLGGGTPGWEACECTADSELPLRTAELIKHELSFMTTSFMKTYHVRFW